MKTHICPIRIWWQFSTWTTTCGGIRVTKREVTCLCSESCNWVGKFVSGLISIQFGLFIGFNIFGFLLCRVNYLILTLAKISFHCEMSKTSFKGFSASKSRLVTELNVIISNGTGEGYLEQVWEKDEIRENWVNEKCMCSLLDIHCL